MKHKRVVPLCLSPLFPKGGMAVWGTLLVGGLCISSFGQTNCATPPPGQVAWWRAEGNMLDSVGTNNGSAPFGIVYSPGRVGQAFSFDAQGRKRVSVPDNDALKLTNSLTIEGWIKIAGDGGFILFRGDSRFQLDPYALTMGTSGHINFHVESLTAMVNLEAPIPYGVWKHVAATLDGATGDMKIYVDAVLTAQTNTTIRPFRDLDPSSDPAIGIGNHGGTSHDFAFNGLIDEISLYSRALTIDEIRSVFLAGSVGKCFPVAPPIVISQPQDQIVPVGGTAIFHVTASGDLLNYQWRFYGTDLPGKTESTLTITNARFADAGPYSVRVFNTANAQISSNAILTVLSNQCVAVPQSPIAWWRAESNTLDSIGTNHGTLFGAPTFVPGRVGLAFNFNGSGQKVIVPDYDALKLTNSFTIEGWIFARGSGFLLFRGDTRPSLDPYSLTVESDGSLQILVTPVSGPVQTLRFANMPLNQWKHVAATLDGATGSLDLYLDGSLVAHTNTAARPLRNLDPAFGAGVGIGGHSGTYGYFPFNGMIDEIALYSRALSSAEIGAIYAAASNGKCPPPSNQPPLAQPQSVVLNEDTEAMITLTGSDPDGDALSYIIGTPGHGVLTGAPPTLVYRPVANYFGPDSFAFRVNDGKTNSQAAIVTITVLPVNDPPVAQTQSLTTSEDTSLNIALSATDVDGDALSFTNTQPAHGTLTGTAPNLVYHPALNFFGPDNFTFRAFDGVTNSQLVTINIQVTPVNDPPAAQIDIRPLFEFPGLSNLLVLGPICDTNAEVVLDGTGSSDVDQDPLNYSWWSGTNLLALGALATNAFSLGTHEITLVVSDGQLSDHQSAIVEVLKPSDLIDEMMSTVANSDLENRDREPLMASLRAAHASLERCNIIPAINQLEAVIRKLDARPQVFGARLREELGNQISRTIATLQAP